MVLGSTSKNVDLQPGHWNETPASVSICIDAKDEEQGKILNKFH